MCYPVSDNRTGEEISRNNSKYLNKPEKVN